MLNAEKYKDKIKELDCRVAIDINSNELKHCNEMNCRNCKFRDNDCGRKRIEWLLEEYEKPILSDSEKIILRDIVRAFEQFGYEIKYIGRYPWSEDENNFYLSFQDEHYNELISPTLYNKTSKMFKEMELEKDYTLEELELNDA